jgi:hypothetical protein
MKVLYDLHILNMEVIYDLGDESDLQADVMSAR